MPGALFLGQHQLLELAVGVEQHRGRRGLETDAALDPQDRVAEVIAPTATQSAADPVEGLDQLDRFVLDAVDGHRQAALEGQGGFQL